MPRNIGTPVPAPLPERAPHTTPTWLPRDGQQVRTPDPDSLDVDGLSVDPGATALRNLGAAGQTLMEAALPDKTAAGLRAACQARRGLSIPVFGILAGLAADLLDLAKAPVTLVKDGLEAAGWAGVAGMRRLAGPEPSRPATAPRPTEPPSFQQVNLRTKTQARTGYFHYALKDGRVWTRWDPILPPGPVVVRCGEPMTAEAARKVVEDAAGPYNYSFDAQGNQFLATPHPDAATSGFRMAAGRLVPADAKQAREWHLHDGMGGPRLPAGEYAVEMQVAGDFIEIRTNRNKMYSYDPTKPDPVTWKAEEGCPFLGDVHLPEGLRDWTFGEAVAVKPIRNCLKSMNPYTDIVGYFEDSRGHKGDFGFTATTGVLMGNGREVRYRDTGLPADFARGFLTPHHGRFTGEKLAGAGATWLLYGREPDGSPGLYARMYDYEINGNCPGRHYSFQEEEVRLLEADRVYSLAGQVQTLPTPGWVKIPFPPLVGRAMLTDHIDLRLTGQGNQAREVRLAGRDAAGRSGFYHKGIAEADWQFTATSDPLLGETVPVGRADSSRATTSPITRDYDRATWGGDLGTAPLRNVELLDFHPFQTQDQASVVRFTLDSGRRVDALLRTGDAYTPFTVRPEDTEKLGEGAGMPKALIGTLDVPQATRNSQDPEVRDFVDRYLMRMHQKENQFMILADTDRVQVFTDWYYRRSDQRFDWEENPRIRVDFQRDDTGQTPFEKRVARADLVPRADMSTAELSAVIDRNRALEAELTGDVKARARHHLKRWMRARGSQMAVTGLMWLGSALNVTSHVGHAGQISQLMPPLMKVHSQADWQTAHRNPPGHQRAVATLRHHIAKAQALLDGRS